MQEIWRRVTGFEGAYEVSSLGRFRSLDREHIGVTPTGHPARRFVTGRLLKQQLNNDGYLRVTLWRHNKARTIRAHRLVAEAFVPASEGCDQVNHIDGNKSNNAAANLEWTTARGNQIHAIENGLARGRRGVEHGMSKLDDDAVREIRALLHQGMVQRRIAEQFGIAPCKVTMIKQGTAWKHVV